VKSAIYRWGVVLLVPGVAACGRTETGDAPQAVASSAAAASAAASPATAAADTMVVYKTPTCGCCNDWVDHVREHGFEVVTHDLPRLDDIKRELGVPAGMVSCHTATVRGYTVEGHVPADLIRRMIDGNETFHGLTVPGMPMGSPGMEGPWKDRYDVLAFDRAGNVRVYDTR
jgi:hypothetical protein